MKNNTLRTAKIKSVLGPVARLIPRLKPSLRPTCDIRESHKGNTGQWTSTGEDPQFACEFPWLDLHTGWYMISLDIECTNVFDVAKFYIDRGEGFQEADSIDIPYQSCRMAKRIVKFDRNISKIRFDPQTCSGSFNVRELTISPVAFKFAEDRMLKKLMRRWPASYDDSVSGTRKLIKAESQRNDQNYQTLLDRKYASLFSISKESQNYKDWIEKVEPLNHPGPNELKALEANIERPLISVIFPTFNTDTDLLEKAIQSVVDQSYSHWQLCISDDGSGSVATLNAIRGWLERDERIVAYFQKTSCGIAMNTNSALALAEGQFCVLLDHDDLLSQHALFEVAKRVVNQKELKLIYSDEDKINGNGERVDPHFKPDWNPDLLLSQNYICHLAAIRRDVIEQVGGCRSGFEGAQDHDLLLRVTHSLSDFEIAHISQVLYHWRMTVDSTAATSDAKSYSSNSGIAAVSDYLSGVQSTAKVVAGKFPNTYRIKWGLPEVAPKVSIIIPTRDGLDILSQCIGSVLERTDYPNYEIVVVDNDSADTATLAYLEALQTEDNIRVLKYNGTFNYSAINNYAVERVEGSVITLMNNDIEVISEEWLSEMVSHALRPDIGCVGAKLLYKNNMIQHAGVILGIGGVAGHAHKYFDAESEGYFSRLHLVQNLSAVTAACLCVEKNIYEKAGGLNEKDLKVAFNDVDFCLRVRAMNLMNVWSPYALLYHHESVSRGHDNTEEKQIRFNKEAMYMQKKWGDLLISDPAYNKNLTRVREDFSLAA